MLKYYQFHFVALLVFWIEYENNNLHPSHLLHNHIQQHNLYLKIQHCMQPRLEDQDQ